MVDYVRLAASSALSVFDTAATALTRVYMPTVADIASASTVSGAVDSNKIRDSGLQLYVDKNRRMYVRDNQGNLGEFKPQSVYDQSSETKGLLSLVSGGVFGAEEGDVKKRARVLEDREMIRQAALDVSVDRYVDLALGGTPQNIDGKELYPLNFPASKTPLGILELASPDLELGAQYYGLGTTYKGLDYVGFNYLKDLFTKRGIPIDSLANTQMALSRSIQTKTGNLPAYLFPIAWLAKTICDLDEPEKADGNQQVKARAPSVDRLRKLEGELYKN